jgi:hypothetical protein
MTHGQESQDFSTSVSGTDRRREVFGVIGLGAALFLLIAMVSLQAHAPCHGSVRPVDGRSVLRRRGVCGYLLIALAVVGRDPKLLDSDPLMPVTVAAATLLGVVALATLIHLVAPSYRVLGHGPGGAIGGTSANPARGDQHGGHALLA